MNATAWVAATLAATSDSRNWGVEAGIARHRTAEVKQIFARTAQVPGARYQVHSSSLDWLAESPETLKHRNTGHRPTGPPANDQICGHTPLTALVSRPSCGYIQRRFLNTKKRAPPETNIAVKASGYPSGQSSSGMKRKFMP